PSPARTSARPSGTPPAPSLHDLHRANPRLEDVKAPEEQGDQSRDGVFGGQVRDLARRFHVEDRLPHPSHAGLYGDETRIPAPRGAPGDDLREAAAHDHEEETEAGESG